MGKLYQKLNAYGGDDFYPYHMPGHKRRLFGEMPGDMMKMDITEIDGFDNLHQPEEILKELQEKAAQLYGAEESFYLINGSTCGILSAISAAIPVGGHLLMARNCHKSAYHAAYLRNLTLSYLYPAVLEEYDICDAVTPKQVREALEAEPDIGAVLIVSPTYEGRIADIQEIAHVVHEKGIPLIVDEAHGAHLGLYETSRICHHGEEMSPFFAANSCQLGADLVIHSVHKTLPAMTQTALLHVNGGLVDRERLRRFLHIYQSSSPSYVLMASIDNALQLVCEQGNQLFADFRSNYLEMLEQLSACEHLQFVPLSAGQDIGKLVISTKKIGLPGKRIYDILLQKYHLQLEMAAGSFCLAMFTIGDTKEAYERMVQALVSVDKDIADGRISVIDGNIFKVSTRGVNRKIAEETGQIFAVMENKSNSLHHGDVTQVIPLAKAWDMEWEQVPLQEAVGRHAAEFINLYPPGVPLLVPGEVLKEQQVRQIADYLAQGLNVQGVSEENPYFVKVLRHSKEKAEA